MAMVFLSWSWRMDLLSESVDPGADDNGEIFGEEGILESFSRSGLSGASFF